jgi:hypothetical protein
MVKLLMTLGLALAVTGVVAWGLAGDARAGGAQGSFSSPLAFSLLISLIATLLLNLFLRGRGRRK